MRYFVVNMLLLLIVCTTVNCLWGSRRSSSRSSGSRSSRSSGWSSRTSSQTSRSTSSRSSRPSMTSGSFWSSGTSGSSPDQPSDTSSDGDDWSSHTSKETVKEKNKIEIELGPFRGTIERERTVTTENTTRNGRNVQWNGDHFNITIDANPCSFRTYDDNRDGAIDEEEMYRIFGYNNVIRDFFNDLDESVDGIVSEEEFYEIAPMTVRACIDIGEKKQLK